ncbi:MAG: hypothetical protein PF904_13645 [Kiritimatiellae bacterium]|nr:hypothetical protein [Kiritimatiellia bacterium]
MFDFDEVRFGTSWADVAPIANADQTLWYDGQGADSLFTNTTYNSSGLHYQMANGEYLEISGGKRITPGTGDAGTDTFSLGIEEESIWQDLSLLDADSGLVGGGDINGVVYFGAPVQLHPLLHRQMHIRFYLFPLQKPTAFRENCA